MPMTLRVEIFPSDLDAAVDFYTRVLGFTLTLDQRDGSPGYLAVERGTVRIGAAHRTQPEGHPGRRPPSGVEIVSRSTTSTPSTPASPPPAGRSSSRPRTRRGG